MPDQLVIFTDLDACLLDEETYRWDPAAPAIEALRDADVPLVLASSKTRPEMVPLAAELGLADGPGCRYPLIVENGGGILMPRAWRPSSSHAAARRPEGWMVTLGAPVAVLDEALRGIAASCGVAARGFSAMTDQEVAALTGLGLEHAARGRQRELDEPFILLDEGGQSIRAGDPRFDAAVRCLTGAAGARGLRVTRGGRFLHLTGDADKGRAARFVLETETALVLRKSRDDRCPRFFSVALGDAPNDLTMLRLVDLPVIVPRPDGRPNPELQAALPRALVAPQPGPAGWNAAVLEVLGRRHAAG